MRRFDACTGRKYQGRDGAEKTAWTRIGTLFENDKGHFSLKLDALPLPNDKGEVWISCFPPKDERQGASAKAKAAARDDEIPF